ncbi:MAG: hypothetical protein OEW48_15205, partial [Phycisphaerae bacterium]|nr:hypothetical protein [Phycisphaerae bacterium]
MKKHVSNIWLISIIAVLLGAFNLTYAQDINTKVSQLDINTANLDDVIRIFGEPEQYLWSGKTFTKDNLPSIYIAAYYSNSLYIVMDGGKINEIRFLRQDIGYVYQDKLKIGSSLDEVLKVVGQPKDIVEKQAMPRTAQDGVLYKDINGRNGYCYYVRRDHRVRFFFLNYNVTALYIMRTKPAEAKRGSIQTTRPIKSVEQFDDVRWKDLSKLDLSDKKDLIPTLRFNQKTVWPQPDKMPPGNKPDKVLKDTMNPGLGVRRLHKQGITGKGVNVAIIDQPLY